MQFSNLFLALPVISSLCSASPHFRRQSTTNNTITAYGTNISALSVVYGQADGLAYIATTTSDDYLALTWTIDPSGTAAWNATTSNSTSVGSFYIVPTTSSFVSAGFVSNSTLPTGAVTAGIGMFGQQVVYMDDEDILAQFWAKTTTTEGVWSLMWNSDGDSETDSVPVTLKLAS